MKVALIASDNNASSGAFLSMTNLAIQLNQLHVKTIVIIPKEGPYVGPGDGVNLLRKHKIKYYVVPSISGVVPCDFPRNILATLGQIKYILRNKIYARGLAGILKKEHVDLVHINTVYSYFGAYAAHKVNIPYVWHIREFLEEDQENEFYFPKYMYKLMNRADLVIAISRSIYKKYSKSLHKNVMKVIYNGIDIDQFYKPERQIFEDSILKLCYVGGLSELKGTDDLIEACRLLNQEGYQDAYRLMIAGRGGEEYEEALREKLKANHIENVELLGFRSDVPDVMAQADVSVVTSRCEAFGRVTVEAMLTGNLVLGADSAGTKELLKNGKFGVLYQCGNPESIKQQMLYILNHKEELRETAQSARDFMAEHMTAKKNAENIYREYQRILGE